MVRGQGQLTLMHPLGCHDVCVAVQGQFCRKSLQIFHVSPFFLSWSKDSSVKNPGPDTDLLAANVTVKQSGDPTFLVHALE